MSISSVRNRELNTNKMTYKDLSLIYQRVSGLNSMIKLYTNLHRVRLTRYKVTRGFWVLSKKYFL